MSDHNIEYIDSEDTSNLLERIEKSFDIKFADNELIYINTLGELCDHIVNKIKLDNTDDWTTQQAYYKLRNAITLLFNIDSKIIMPDYSINNFLPRKERKERIRNLEEYLGFQLKITRPPYWMTTLLLIMLLVSIFGIFFNWKLGLISLCISIGGIWLLNKIGNELDIQTVGQLAEKMTKENYLKSRRNPKTVNRNEIEKLLIEWFINDLGLDKRKLTREAKFV